ncbi:hypothetical protein ACLX1H_004273 [Fusarium chlamydosporum]
MDNSLLSRVQAINAMKQLIESNLQILHPRAPTEAAKVLVAIYRHRDGDIEANTVNVAPNNTVGNNWKADIITSSGGCADIESALQMLMEDIMVEVCQNLQEDNPADF